MTRQEYLTLKETYIREGKEVALKIAGIVNGRLWIDKSTVIAAAYVLYRANDEEVDVTNIQSFCESTDCNEDRKAFINDSLADDWPMVVGQRYRYSSVALKSILLFNDLGDERLDGSRKTPDSVAKLACSLFDFEDGSLVADFGIGAGLFATEAHLTNQSLSFYGVEINASLKEMTSIKFEMLGLKAEIEHNNILDLNPETHRFKYIFSNYPFGLGIKDWGLEWNKLLQKTLQKSPAFSKGTSSDWLFNAAIVECLEPEGKGIAIMTNGSTWNTLDKSARKYFIDNDLVEAVISLPERLFEYTSIPTTMIVFGRNTGKIMLVDATNMCEKGRRLNSFTDANIEDIVKATKNESIHSKLIPIEELESNDYVINATRYLTASIVVENGVPFEKYIKSITRGAPLSADDLDLMISNEPTNYQYLMLSNIQNGQIDSNLPYIKRIEENQQRYCIKNHDLILSKNGAPFKIAVAEVEPGKTILANGNLFIIEIDETKASPYYIKAFLESEQGTALLKSITVGATIPSIGIRPLKRLPIPYKPIEEQLEFAQRYQAKVDEIAIIKRKLQKTIEELNHIFDNKG